MLTDRFTARVLAGLFFVFPFLMGGATLVMTGPELRTSKLYSGIAIMSVPVWVVGAALFYRSTRMKE